MEVAFLISLAVISVRHGTLLNVFLLQGVIAAIIAIPWNVPFPSSVQELWSALSATC